MLALPLRPPVDTGPIEGRDFGPTGRRLGTVEDCYDGSPWELHRGELWEQMGSKDIHGIVMALLAKLFGIHARSGLTVMTDVYCDLSDRAATSVRAPDVVLVGDLAKPKDAIYTGKPILAVEVRGTQSKHYLEEKVKLYIEHDWPCTWIVHVRRQQVEVLRPGSGSVVYQGTAMIPLLPELDQYGLTALPVAAVFDQAEARPFGDGWVEARTRAKDRAEAVLAVLGARGFAIADAARARVLGSQDMEALGRWLSLAATAPSVEAFVAGLG
jgi:Putative restriction endonuclease